MYYKLMNQTSLMRRMMLSLLLLLRSIGMLISHINFTQSALYSIKEIGDNFRHISSFPQLASYTLSDWSISDP